MKSGHDLTVSNLSDLHLSLWKQALGAVPDHVWDLTNLQSLVLADNGLAELSDRVGELRALRTLDLGHNQLRHIPAALGELVSLSDFLYLHENALQELPRLWGDLPGCATSTSAKTDSRGCPTPLPRCRDFSNFA